jgi:hypothetical protein
MKSLNCVVDAGHEHRYDASRGARHDYQGNSVKVVVPSQPKSVHPRHTGEYRKIQEYVRHCERSVVGSRAEGKRVLGTNVVQNPHRNSIQLRVRVMVACVDSHMITGIRLRLVKIRRRTLAPLLLKTKSVVESRTHSRDD